MELSYSVSLNNLIPFVKKIIFVKNLSGKDTLATDIMTIPKEMI